MLKRATAVNLALVTVSTLLVILPAFTAIQAETLVESHSVNYPPPLHGGAGRNN